MVRAVIIVSGIVQGVGFRYFVRNSAKFLKVTGYVKNLEDETVEIAAEGIKEDIQSLIRTIRSVKEPASVDDVKVSYGEATGEFKSFKIITGDLRDELVEGLGTGHMLLMASNYKQDQMLGKQDQMLGKQDQMLGKQDQMLGKQDQMLGKQDQMLGKQDQTVTGIRALSNNMQNMMDIRFNRLEGEIRLIKEKIGS